MQARISAGWIGLDTVGSAIFSFAALLAYAHLLQPSEFGDGALAISISMLSAAFVSSAIYTSLVRADFSEEIPSGMGPLICLCFSTFSAATLFGMASYISFFLDRPALAQLLKWASLGVFSEVFQSYAVAELHRRLDFRWTAIRSLISRAAGAISGVLIAWNGGQASSFIYQYIVGAVVGGVIIAFVVPPSLKARFRFSAAVRLLSFGGSAGLANAAANSSYHLFTATLSIFITSEQLGYLSLAVRLIETFRNLLVSSLTSAAFAYFCAQARSGNDFRLTLIQYSSTTTLAGIYIFGLISITAFEMIFMVFGSDWSAAVFPMQVFCLTASFSLPIALAYCAILASGRPNHLIGLNVFLVTWTSGLVVLLRPQSAWMSALIWASQSFVAAAATLAILHTAVKVRSYIILSSALKLLIGGGASIVATGVVSATIGASSVIASVVIKFFTWSVAFGIFSLLLERKAVQEAVRAGRDLLYGTSRIQGGE